MTTFLMIRHGQSEANLQGRFAGQYDSLLTELGHQQAERTARFIAENYHVDAVYASDLQRAYDTGLAAAKKLGLPVTADKALREIYAGQWEGIPFERMNTEYPEQSRLWRSDIGNSGCPGGETVAQLAQRIWSALERIAGENEGKTVVIATHATPIRTMLWKTTGKDLGEMQNIPWPSNASVTELVYRGGKLIPVKISQDSHLADIKSALPPNV